MMSTSGPTSRMAATRSTASFIWSRWRMPRLERPIHTPFLSKPTGSTFTASKPSAMALRMASAYSSGLARECETLPQSNWSWEA